MMLHRIARSSLSCRQLYSRPTLLVVKPSYLIQPYLRRSYVTEADHRADGVPSDVAGTAPKDAQSGYFYLDNIFPIRISFWDIRYQITRLERTSLLENIRDKLIPDDVGHGFRIKNIEPRMKDGGAFVYFNYFPGEDPAHAIRHIELTLQKHIDDMNIRPWYSWQKAHIFLVKGQPWMEDMYRFPYQRLRVEFEGPDVPQEELYNYFRTYGKIADIVPQPSSNKDTPRFAVVQYTHMRSATAARNCLHGIKISPTGEDTGPMTRLNIFYERPLKAHVIREWITTHPRITIPLVAALLASFTYLVFDPVREFFVESKISRTFDVEGYRIYRWLKKETVGRLGLSRERDLESTFLETGTWKEREDAAMQLDSWLKDMPDTFIVVQGPKGSGKSGLIHSVLNKEKHTLFIDCEEITHNARNDTGLVTELAKQVGYFPVFSFLNSINNLMDLASAGLIGQKAGFASSTEAQIKAILETTANALTNVAATAIRKKHKRQAKEKRAQAAHEIKSQGGKEAPSHDGRIDCVSGSGVMSELGVGIEKQTPKDSDEYAPLEQSPVSKPIVLDDEIDQHFDVDELPIIVIKGYLHKEAGKRDDLWDALAEWAALLVENQMAHVIFESDNIAVTKPLGKALPNKPLNLISLTDASESNTLKFVGRHLGEDMTSSIKDQLKLVGGRLLDLEVLIQKIKSGQDPQEAIDDLVERNVVELKKYAFGDDSEDAKALPWTNPQVWSIFSELAKKDEVKYAQVLMNDFFDGDDGALHALEQAEMIGIEHHKDGRQMTIRPGKPLYRAAYAQLLHDPVFAAQQGLGSNNSLIKKETANISKYEEELHSLSETFASGAPKQVKSRILYLLGKMQASQGTIERLEANNALLKRRIAEAK